MKTQKNTTCLIVDDNAFNRQVLADLLSENHPSCKLLGTAENGTEAIHLIEKLKPELVFLDVEMPDMNGFEVLVHTKALDFQTIFTTAHSQYAIQAIRFNALDYLMKPIKPKELATALKRYQSNAWAIFNKDRIRQALQNMEAETAQDMVLYLPTQEGGLKMVLADILMIEGERNYSTIHLEGGKTRLSSKTLGYFEEILAGKGFFRCHRSFIVNKAHIEKLQSDYCLMTTNAQIPISRRRKTAFKDWFNK